MRAGRQNRRCPRRTTEGKQAEKAAGPQGPKGLVHVLEVAVREENGEEAEKAVQQVTAENVPKSARDISLLIQKAQRMSSRITLKRLTGHLTITLLQRRHTDNQ